MKLSSGLRRVLNALKGDRWFERPVRARIEHRPLLEAVTNNEPVARAYGCAPCARSLVVQGLHGVTGGQAAGCAKLYNSGLAWMTATNMRSIWLGELFTHPSPTGLGSLLAR